MAKTLHLTRSALILLAGILGALLVLYAFRLPPFSSAVQSTENAYVRGQVTILSPQLSGDIAEVAVEDYQQVRAGQLLIRIDDRLYVQRLRQAEANLDIQRARLANSEQDQRMAEARIHSAEAQVAGAEANLQNADAAAHRIDPLLSRGIATQSAADQAHAALAQARAALLQAEAGLDVARQDLQSVVVNRTSLVAGIENAEAALRMAEIDLGNTRITAPQDGRLGEVGARPGQYVSAGTQLVSLVPARKWVVANFKETQLAGMRLGQHAELTVDALNHARLHGRVEAFSPATGSEFSVLRPDNATGNFTKVAQRLPVRIALDPSQPEAELLAPGMSVVVSIDTRAAPLP
jgi:multidrug resistance efflux pump